jgi:hypothetical protein
MQNLLQVSSICRRVDISHLFHGLATSSSQVKAFLQWAKAARLETGGKMPLFVNMDETSVAMHFGRQRGLVVRQRSLPPGKAHKKEHVTSGDAKANISFLAFMTHEADIQKKLPQIFISSKHQIPAKSLGQITPYLPENVYLWREDSAWNCHASMRKAMCTLAKHLEEYAATHQIILVLDVAKCHYHSSIFTLATRKGIRLLYVPAKLTWLLQPADTHAFSRLKQRLRKAWLSLCVGNATGAVGRVEWLQQLFSIAKKLFTEVQWHSAFESCGLLDERKLSQRVLRQLGWATPVTVNVDVLTPEQLAIVFPRRAKVSSDAIFRWAAPKAKAKAKPEPKAKAAAKAAAIAPSDGPPCHGTRKRAAKAKAKPTALD